MNDPWRLFGAFLCTHFGGWYLSHVELRHRNTDSRLSSFLPFPYKVGMQINIEHVKRVQEKRKELYYRVRKLARNSKVVLLLDFVLVVKSPLRSVLTVISPRLLASYFRIIL